MFKAFILLSFLLATRFFPYIFYGAVFFFHKTRKILSRGSNDMGHQFHFWKAHIVGKSDISGIELLSGRNLTKNTARWERVETTMHLHPIHMNQLDQTGGPHRFSICHNIMIISFTWSCTIWAAQSRPMHVSEKLWFFTYFKGPLQT